METTGGGKDIFSTLESHSSQNMTNSNQMLDLACNVMGRRGELPASGDDGMDISSKRSMRGHSGKCPPSTNKIRGI